MSSPEEWISIGEAGGILRVSRSRVAQFIKAGTVESRKVKHHVRVRRADVDSLAAERAAEAEGDESAAENKRFAAELRRMRESETQQELESLRVHAESSKLEEQVREHLERLAAESESHRLLRAQVKELRSARRTTCAQTSVLGLLVMLAALPEEQKRALWEYVSSGLRRALGDCANTPTRREQSPFEIAYYAANPDASRGMSFDDWGELARKFGVPQSLPGDEPS